MRHGRWPAPKVAGPRTHVDVTDLSQEHVDRIVLDAELRRNDRPEAAD
jgi:hypothetical protein